MDTVAFTSSSLLHTPFSALAPRSSVAACAPGGPQTPLQAAQCKNAELGQWYTETIERKHAASLNLDDMRNTRAYTHVKLWVAAVELAGVFVCLYASTR